MSRGVASGWARTSWGRPGRQVDGLSRIFVSPFGALSRGWFLSQLLPTNGATLEQNCALGCHSFICFPVVTPLHYSFDEIFCFCRTVARIDLPCWKARLEEHRLDMAGVIAHQSSRLGLAFREFVSKSLPVWEGLAEFR